MQLPTTREDQRGAEPQTLAPGFGWKELGALAQSSRDHHADRSVVWLRADVGLSIEDVETMLRGVTDAELFEVCGRSWDGAKWPNVEWAQVNTTTPYGPAGTKLRRSPRERD